MVIIIAIINTVIIFIIMSAFLTRARTLQANVDGFMVSVMMMGPLHGDEQDDQLTMRI